MSDDIINRLFAKLDDVNVRLARLETAVEERAKGSAGTWQMLAWLCTTGIALYAAVHK